MNILKNDVSFLIYPMTGATKSGTLPGSSEKKIARFLVANGKWVSKVTGYTTQLPIHKGHVCRH
jgi:hypothetical protein